MQLSTQPCSLRDWLHCFYGLIPYNSLRRVWALRIILTPPFTATLVTPLTFDVDIMLVIKSQLHLDNSILKT